MSTYRSKESIDGEASPLRMNKKLSLKTAGIRRVSKFNLNSGGLMQAMTKASASGFRSPKGKSSDIITIKEEGVTERGS